MEDVQVLSNVSDGVPCRDIGYLLVGGKDGGAVHSDAGVTTEKAAASAGGQVLRTDPKLNVEPK